ncbi:MAG: GNAT family N-acetyltransferase [Candidatus Abyssobacteria bacterium SURF_5]|uniref:GNAT family N-acetyltransferase n=1 Tax=Abyssobacteria bacterium (strain SURF_5) TaxID=2093360 RepID=A0A3A4NNZ5_ABYX5|nr:MAG: GNAT family N-acetyltransferase [Candidatus Abyssubacteria bacterium SURF_5]
MYVEHISDFSQFESLREEWNSFVDRCDESHISHTHEWLVCWWKAFRENAQLWILLFRKRGRLAGILPLMLRRKQFRGFPVRVLSFPLNGHTPEGGLLFEKSQTEGLEHFLRYLHDGRNRWDILRLEKVYQKCLCDTDFPLLLDKNNLRHVHVDTFQSPYVETTADWDEYYASRSKKFRKVMRNKLNRMNQDGLLSMERLTGADITPEALEEIFDVSRRSWKAQLKRSIPDDVHVENFYREITAALAPLEKVDVWLMRRNGKVVAFEYHLKHKGIIYPIRADFDDFYHVLSPGSLLEFLIMKRLFDDPLIRGCNSCGRTYDYLMHWATDIIEHREILIFNSRSYSRQLFFLESKIVPIAKKAKTWAFDREQNNEKVTVQRDARKIHSIHSR